MKRNNFFVADNGQLDAIISRLCPADCPHKREEPYVNIVVMKSPFCPGSPES